MSPRASLKIDGRRAEALVANHLASQGFSLLGQNVRVGRLELDLLAQKHGVLVVCEVRSRSRADFLDPWQTVDREKQERIRRATREWLSRAGMRFRGIRFDVASVVFDRDPPRLEYFANAFE